MARVLVWDNGECYSDQAWYFYAVPDGADANQLRHNLERVHGGEVVGVFEVIDWWHGGADELPDMGELRPARPCPRCDSTRWLDRGMGVKCPECRGWGTLDLELCTLCRGEGAYETAPGKNWNHREKCYRCEQTGYHPVGRK